MFIFLLCSVQYYIDNNNASIFKYYVSFLAKKFINKAFLMLGLFLKGISLEMKFWGSKFLSFERYVVEDLDII